MRDRSNWNAYQRERYRAKNPAPKRYYRDPAGGRVVIPDAVLAEAAAALSAPMTLTASICGDPPKGRSALDRAPKSSSRLPPPFQPR